MQAGTLIRRLGLTMIPVAMYSKAQVQEIWKYEAEKSCSKAQRSGSLRLVMPPKSVNVLALDTD